MILQIIEQILDALRTGFRQKQIVLLQIGLDQVVVNLPARLHVPHLLLEAVQAVHGALEDGDPLLDPPRGHLDTPDLHLELPEHVLRVPEQARHLKHQGGQGPVRDTLELTVVLSRQGRPRYTCRGDDSVVEGHFRASYSTLHSFKRGSFDFFSNL